MATESPLLHDGAQTVLSTGNDARRTSITGSTLAGPNGSGQFLCVALSTLTDRTVNFCSTASTANVGQPSGYGVLQNTPGPGQAADVGIFGISKVVAGSTNFARGSVICPSSLFQGTVAAFSTTNIAQYNPIGFALETPTSTGAVITAFINTGMVHGTTV